MSATKEQIEAAAGALYNLDAPGATDGWVEMKSFARFSNIEWPTVTAEKYLQRAAAALNAALSLSPPGELDHDNAQFNQGVTHTVELLAKALGVDDWVHGDGSEDYDEDLQQTLMNIVERKGLYDPGDGKWASLSPPADLPVELDNTLKAINVLAHTRGVDANVREKLQSLHREVRKFVDRISPPADRGITVTVIDRLNAIAIEFCEEAFKDFGIAPDRIRSHYVPVIRELLENAILESRRCDPPADRGMVIEAPCPECDGTGGHHSNCSRLHANIRAAMREECAKVARNYADHEIEKQDAIKRDRALSDTGRNNLLDLSAAARRAAFFIETRIRSLSTQPNAGEKET